MKKLFVGNVPFQASESELEQWFTRSGVNISRVNVIRDHFSGESRGFGFVEIDQDDDASRAIESCNGREFMGRALVVNEARPNPRDAGNDRGHTNGDRVTRAAGRRW